MEILERTPVASIIFVILAVVGGVDVIADGNLSAGFHEYVKVLGIPLGLFAVGRGASVYRKPS